MEVEKDCCLGKTDSFNWMLHFWNISPECYMFFFFYECWRTELAENVREFCSKHMISLPQKTYLLT